MWAFFFFFLVLDKALWGGGSQSIPQASNSLGVFKGLSSRFLMPCVAPWPVFLGLLLCSRHCCRHWDAAVCPQAKCSFSSWGGWTVLFGIPPESLLDLVLCLPPFFCVPLNRTRIPLRLPFARPVSSTWFTPLLPGKLLLLLQGWVQASFSQWTHGLPTSSCFLPSGFSMVSWELSHQCVFPVRWVVTWGQGSCLLWSFPCTELGPVQIRWSNPGLHWLPESPSQLTSPCLRADTWDLDIRLLASECMLCTSSQCVVTRLLMMGLNLYMVLICPCPPA